MRLLKVENAPSSFSLALVSDFHDGAKGYHETGVKKLMDGIASAKNRFWAFLGDGIDAVCTDDKRYHYVRGDTPLPLKQAMSFVKTCKPAAKKCWAMMKGNHEDKLHRFGDITEDLIAAPLEVQYGGYVCKLAVHDKHGLMFKLYLWHGPMRGSVTSKAKDHLQRQANMKASVRRYLENKASDCAVMACGHTHLLLVAEPAPKLLLSDNGAKITSGYLRPPEPGETYIEPDRRWYVNTGSYLRSQMIDDDSYAELAGYDPIELGHAEVVVEDRRIVEVRRVVAA